MSLIETDSLSNQDLSSELEIASFTAEQYYKALQAEIHIDQIAGNGDYIIVITKQRAGAGTAYHAVDVTQTVRSGVTDLFVIAEPFAVNDTDVVKVLVTGLAGDTTTPDTIVEWHDVSSPTVEEVRAEMDSNSTQFAAIKAVTDLLTAARAEPTGAPAANEVPLTKLDYIFAALRNKLTVSASAKTFYDDAGTALWSKALSDDGTTYTEQEGS